MSYAKIVLTGNFLPDEVVIHIESNSRQIHEEIEAKAKTIWLRQLEDAKKNGRELWDSEEYRMDKAYEKEGKLHIHLSTIPFSIASGMKEMPEVGELDPTYYPLGLGILTVPHTKDNKYIIGGSGKRFYGKSSNKALGGAVVKTENEVKSANDLFLALYKELEEEAGIRSSQIKQIHVNAIIWTRMLHAGIVTATDLSITSEEVEDQFQKRHDGELSKLFFVEKKNLLPYAKDIGQYDPIFEELFTSLV
jgi:hypothetical protein